MFFSIVTIVNVYISDLSSKVASHKKKDFSLATMSKNQYFHINGNINEMTARQLSSTVVIRAKMTLHDLMREQANLRTENVGESGSKLNIQDTNW